MDCSYFDAGLCRSCTLLPVPMSTRVESQQAEVAELLAPFWATGETGTPEQTWLPPVMGPESGFRIKVKMVVAGTTEHPTLGILDDDGAGIDLTDCPLYPESIHTVIRTLPWLIKRAQIPPYNVRKRKGQLKHVIVTAGDDNRVMVRFVLASQSALPRIQEHLPAFMDACEGVEVFSVSANINPVHTAIIEGDEEIALHGPQWLPVTQGRVQLKVRPQSFVQTNTVVASGLYEQVREWVSNAEVPATSHGRHLKVWDLFCGVGGFALHVAGPGRQVTGVEVAPAAVESAREVAGENDLGLNFICADAAQWSHQQTQVPDVLIVNPPRRGMGEDMAGWVEQSGIPHVIYSSCNPRTLAADLAKMPEYRIEQARFLDMFPHTSHAEVVALMRRT
ncbi:methyltransferase domain-containing protein [Brevibacterium sp. UMB1308A]|uniref:methyltransferase domain-containing protein n=1 Tax=Brevibacterium sp. UMB1308A TaxID=3050608 RepID=UPI00254B8340|nr:methyltransferase domain-containing protein [Brevibacterium sp. UMB1308A]MDK8347401.1 methyltransferase domain-containing protein [Brevibacterium sp. UMB1308B]MDK8714299.1 methyltransferase domain-containing protein [Brevibacterium sp. UMB1308A]